MKNIKGQSATARMLDFIALINFGITAPVTADTRADIEAGAIMGNMRPATCSQYSGWEPVWSAGEMKIWNGKVTVVNNESGHFKPPAANVTYVVNTLRAYGIPIDSNLKSGSYQQNPAALTESECGTLLGKDEL